ncbi:hypothetical protein BDZ89DRAFT_1170035, partial [Hymenopellis radicata]
MTLHRRCPSFCLSLRSCLPSSHPQSILSCNAADPLLYSNHICRMYGAPVYDYILTLDREIAYIWPNPGSISGILFFTNRYLPFIDSMMEMDLEFRSDNTLQKCWVNNIIITWLIVIGVWISEVILTLRTY